MSEKPGIGTLGEKSLHAALKAWYARPGDRFEVSVDGFVVDIVRGDLLVEIQTRNFGAIRRKLERLILRYPIHLIHPIPYERWIVKLRPGAEEHPGGAALSRRKSPRRGSLAQVFRELVRMPHLIAQPNFSLEVVLIRDEEIRVNDGQGSWRRKGWSVHDRRLLEVVESHSLSTLGDWNTFLPPDLPPEFTALDLAQATGHPRPLAQKIVYCLRHAGLLTITGRRGNAYIYLRTL